MIQFLVVNKQTSNLGTEGLHMDFVLMVDNDLFYHLPVCHFFWDKLMFSQDSYSGACYCWRFQFVVAANTDDTFRKSM